MDALEHSRVGTQNHLRDTANLSKMRCSVKLPSSFRQASWIKMVPTTLHYKQRKFNCTFLEYCDLKQHIRTCDGLSYWERDRIIMLRCCELPLQPQCYLLKSWKKLSVPSC